MNPVTNLQYSSVIYYVPTDINFDAIKISHKRITSYLSALVVISYFIFNATQLAAVL